MRIHQPADHNAALIRLAGELDRLSHDVADLGQLRGEVEAHSRALRDLADVIRRITATGNGSEVTEETAADAEPAPEWLTAVDVRLAVLWLAQLQQWTRDVWIHYAPLIACWCWHPQVVAELLWCQHLWSAAAAVGAGPDGLAAWHDRWRPGVATRISRALAACERSDGAHVAADGTRWVIDPAAAADEIAVWWATTHGATPPPGLTREDYR